MTQHGTSPTRHRVGIIGAGRLGRALAQALHLAGHDVVAASSRTSASRDRLRSRLDVPVVADTVEVARCSDVLVCCVPDDALVDVAAELASVLADADLPTVVVTASGAADLQAFAPLVVRGVAAARIHPLQVFTDGSGPDAFHGVTAAVAASDEATLACAREVAASIGLLPVTIDDSRRASWHAAATMTANYTVTLLAAARDLAVHAGVSEGDALRSLGALAHVAIDRAVELGPERSLTGPVSRGDVGTIVAHLEALGAVAPELLDSYRALGERTAALAAADGRLDDAARKAVVETLDHATVAAT